MKDNSQIMTKKEMTERGFSTDKDNRIIDDMGNEYRNEQGECMYLEKNKSTMEDKMMKSFEVSAVCREDLTSFISRKKAEKLTDFDMEWIARKMGDSHCDCCYWETLKLTYRFLQERK